MKSTEQVMNSCLNLMRRLPPDKISQNLSSILPLVPQVADELLQRIDQPLEIAHDTDTVSRNINMQLMSHNQSLAKASIRHL